MLKNNFAKFLLFFFPVCLLIIFSGCGPKETSAGAVGAASGAVVGSAISSDKNKGTGTLLGAVVGNYIGRKIGRSEDRRDEPHEKISEREKLKDLKEENRFLRKKLKKWCDHCQKSISLDGANNCPYCGSKLIKKKYCRNCRSTFKPESNYRYCPYCEEENIRLNYR